jgi:hypothetical protein
MRRIVLLAFGLLLSSAAYAADNAVIVTPGTGVTMKSKDIGSGVQSMQPVISDTSGNALVTPTAGADTVSNSTEGLAVYNFPLLWNGTTWDRWKGDATNGAYVNIKAGSIANTSFGATQATAANLNATVVGTGTFVTQSTLAAETTKVIGTVNQGTSPWVVSNGGTFAVQAAQTTAANLNMTEASAAAILSAVQGAIPAGTAVIGTLAPLDGVSVATTGAAAGSLVAKSSAGSVVSISGSAANASYIMLFNATSAPADGAVTPLKCWGPMSAAGPFALSWGIGPVLTMSTGITVVSSSTGCFTKTVTNAAFLSVEYK